jgi:ABC-type glycerol-3-phosphate transport system permease component
MAVLAEQTSGSGVGLLTRPRLRRGKVGRLAILWILNLFFLFFFLFPFYWQTVTSLKSSLDIAANPIVWFPTHFVFTHY